MSTTQPKSHASTSAPLPAIGAPLRTGWNDGHRRHGTPGRVAAARQDKLGLWTAVALQNHFRQVGAAPLTAATEASTGLQAHRLPPAQPRQRPTLAQRMGLVPQPPPAPTEAEWQIAEARALQREQIGGHAQRLGDEVCGICLEPFFETLQQGQVILSCSHVFHQNCFRQFERFTRLQQREEGAAASLLLACPECRQTHYHKRTFFAGKALAQHAAVVRIQACVRRYLAEKRYTQLRLQHNAEFREAFVQQRLAKLSDAWERYIDRREAQQEALLAGLDAKRQAAAAAYLTEAQWQAIIRRSECSATANVSGLTTGTNAAALTGDTVVVDPSSPACGSVHECPICLEAIERDRNATTSDQPEPLSGDAYVQQLRREYEAGRAAADAANEKTKTSRQKKKTGKQSAPPPPRRAKTTPPAQHHPAQRVCTLRGDPVSPAVEAKVEQPRVSEPTLASVSSLQVTGAETDRGGVILSCGHCFHDVCLSVFERYSEWRVLEEGVTYAPPRCPLCRAGYAKHVL